MRHGNTQTWSVTLQRKVSPSTADDIVATACAADPYMQSFLTLVSGIKSTGCRSLAPVFADFSGFPRQPVPAPGSAGVHAPHGMIHSRIHRNACAHARVGHTDNCTCNLSRHRDIRVFSTR